MDTQSMQTFLSTTATELAVKVLAAIAFWIIGRWLIGRVIGKIFGDTIQNFSTLPVRRVERVAQLAGSVDPLEAIERFKAAVAKLPNVSTERPPEVNLLGMNLNGPVVAVRPYTHTDHYWQVFFETNEMIVRVCREAGWPAPTPTQITRVVQA